MPLTTDHFWFEELKRVKDLPVGDKEILTKYVGGKGQPDNTYLLIRKLPLNLRDEPVGVVYFYNYNPANGGSVWLCQDFGVKAVDMRDAVTELAERSQNGGLTLDDGTVLFPEIKDYFAAFPILERDIPAKIKNRSGRDVRNVPETGRSVIAGAIKSTFLVGQMEHPLLRSMDVAIVGLELRGASDPATVTIRWRRAR